MLAAPGQGGVRLTAVSAEAAADGLVPGLTVAEARALVPALLVGDADPLGDAADLQRLALWCRRWTPRVAADGEDGLLLDITGCDHLFGGEGGLVTDIAARLGRAGIGHRLGLAGTPAAAWGWTRYRPARSTPVLRPEEAVTALGRLPTDALRLPPDMAVALGRVGLRRIEDLLRLPRAPLAARFGRELLDRLDRLTGAAADPLTPVEAPGSWGARLALAEPISRREDFEEAASRLLAELAEGLRTAGRGARALRLSLFRVDGSLQVLEIGTGRPSRDPRHLLRLFRERFDRIEPGFGVEIVTLEAAETNPLPPEQTETDSGGAGTALPELVDRLRTRAGGKAALRLSVCDTHVPERSVALRPYEEDVPLPDDAGEGERPVLLLSPPEPIQGDGTGEAVPEAFYWRGRRYHVGLVEGPERIRSEWWRDRDAVRDYYRVQEIGGRRFWIFRRRGSALDGWFLHGLFA